MTKPEPTDEVRRIADETWIAYDSPRRPSEPSPYNYHIVATGPLGSHTVCATTKRSYADRICALHNASRAGLAHAEAHSGCVAAERVAKLVDEWRRLCDRYDELATEPPPTPGAGKAGMAERALARLLRIGQQLSNVAYHWAQSKDVDLDPRDRKMLDGLRRDWDAAQRAHREEKVERRKQTKRKSRSKR